MNEAKAPSKTDWQYVDIFVFSNGQQATPPRKYYLSISDLNNWANTLKTMARSQYEQIFSSIDLYTVDGQPVLTPMQVTHGAAYVAVPPHDTFITAGYNDYLLKASKSRERRKSRNLSIVERPQDMDNKEKRTNQIDKYEQEIKVLQEEKEITTTITNPTDITPVSEPQISIHNNPNDTKQPERSPSGNRPVAAKNSLTNPQAFRRTSMKSKDTISRKNLKVNTSSGIAPKTNGFNNINRSKINTITKRNKFTDKEIAAMPVALSTIDENVQTNSSNLYKVSSTTKEDKLIFTERSALENAIDDKELIVVKYPDSEMTTLLLERDKSASYKHTILSSTDPAGHASPVNENFKSELKNIELKTDDRPKKDTKNPMDIVENRNEIINNDSVFNDKNESKLCCEVSVLPNLASDVKINHVNKSANDNFVAVVDRRDVFNLNLKIELRKCSGLDNGQCDTNPTKLNRITEKCSQANIDLDGLNNCSNKESNPISEVNPKIVVVHCTCCNYHNVNDILRKIGTGAVKLEDKNYVLLLPTPRLDQNDVRENYQEKTNDSETPHPSRSSAENPVKKVYAYHILETLGDINKSKATTSRTDSIKANEDKRFNRDRNNVNKKVSVPILISKSSKQVMTANSENYANQQTQNTDSITRRSSTKSSADHNTQTDWCSLLLEARRNENGCYSFHLPPLQVLKYYGF